MHVLGANVHLQIRTGFASSPQDFCSWLSTSLYSSFQACLSVLEGFFTQRKNLLVETKMKQVISTRREEIAFIPIAELNLSLKESFSPPGASSFTKKKRKTSRPLRWTSNPLPPYCKGTFEQFADVICDGMVEIVGFRD